jgi:hypothetical protein
MSSRSNFTSSTGGRRPDFTNSHYFRSSRGGRGGRGGSTTRPAHDVLPEANMKEGLDTTKIVETMSQPTRPTAPEESPIKNVKYVASYNWIDKEKPTIAVPGATYISLLHISPFLTSKSVCSGSPSIWTGRAVPFTLRPDDDTVFVDQNGARLSEYPMLPLFIAADEIHGQKAAPVDWPMVDVITDRNGLRKLLRWLNPSPGREVRDFRIDVELMGSKTLVLGRWEGRRREPPSGRSYGFRFEDATTRAAPGCPSSGHHRTITYVRDSFFFIGSESNVPFFFPPIGYTRHEDGGSFRGRRVLAY